MNTKNLLILLITVLLSQVISTAENVKPPIEYVDSVHPIANLTSQNFDTYVTSQEYGSWFVMFYAPWCPHCKNSAPSWIELSKVVEGATNIGMVDGDTNSYLTRRFLVRGYPTFIFFNDGKMYNYDGPRSVEGWKSFVEEGYKHSPYEEIPENASTFGQFYKELQVALGQVKSLALEQPLLVLAIIIGFLVFTIGSFWCVFYVTERINAGPPIAESQKGEGKTEASETSKDGKVKKE